MKNTIPIALIIAMILTSAGEKTVLGQAVNQGSVINKGNGRIIKAYTAFADFLNTDKSWQSYRKTVLDAFPEIKAVHSIQLSWGSIDSAGFQEEIKNYKKEDWEKYFNEYDDRTLNILYDSVVRRENNVLCPISSRPVDLCLFLPYGGCFIIAGQERCTIYISLLIDPADAEKIMVHEYAHNLHLQRHPMEPYRFRREVVAEGIAVYVTTLTLKDLGIFRAIPFMPESSVKWCFDHEQTIKDAIRPELDDTTFISMKKYISDGSVATPPQGFVEKTAYFAGYRIIKACLDKGLTLEKICTMDSKDIIEESGYFSKEN